MVFKIKALNGWTVWLSPGEQIAAIGLCSLHIPAVKVIGDTQNVTPYSNILVHKEKGEYYVVTSIRALGGGCTSSAHSKIHSVTSSIIIIANEVPKGDSATQTIAEELAEEIQQSLVREEYTGLRISELETIQPMQLVNSLVLAATLMKGLQNEGLWNVQELYKLRSRLVCLTRKFCVNWVLREVATKNCFEGEELGEFMEFWEGLAAKSQSEYDREVHVQASLFLKFIKKGDKIVEWINVLRTEGLNLYSCYFGGVPLESIEFYIKKLSNFPQTMALFNLMLVYDQSVYVKELNSRDLLIEFLDVKYHKQWKTMVLGLLTLEFLIGTYRVSDQHCEDFISILQSLCTFTGMKAKHNEKVQSQAITVLYHLDRSTHVKYILCELGSLHSLPRKTTKNSFKNISKLLDKVVLLPCPSSVAFTGREKELAFICETLMTDLAHSLALYGEGGIGKSRIAYEYALRHQAEYDVIAWIHSDTPETMNSSVIRLAESLGIELLDSIEDIIDSVKGHIDSNKLRTLLIYDGVTCESDAVHLSPRQCHVLMTTGNNKNWSNIYTIEELPLDAAAHIFCGLTGAQDSTEVHTLMQTLNLNPFCIIRAAYLATQSPEPALSSLNSMISARILEKKQYKRNYPVSAHVVVEQSVACLKAANENAASFLTFLCFMYPVSIPPLVYRELLRLTNLSEDSLRLLNALVVHKFVQFSTDGSLTLSKIVAAATSSSILHYDPYTKPVSSVFSNLIRAAYDLETASPSTFIASFELWAAHAEMYLRSYIEYYRAAYMENVLYFFHLKIRHHQVTRSLWVDEEYLTEKIEQYLANFELSSPLVLLLILKIHEFHERFVGSLELYEKCVVLQRGKFDANHSDLADALCVLAAAELDKDQVEESLGHYNEALEIQRAVYPAGSFSISCTLEKIGSALERKEEPLDSVLSFYIDSLDHRKSITFSYHPGIAETLIRIAEVYDRADMLAESLDYYKQAIEVLKNYYHPTHPRISDCLTLIAGTYFKNDEIENSLIYYKDALKLLKKVYTHSHIKIAVIYSEKANIYYLLGNDDKALECQEKGRKIQQRRSTRKFSAIQDQRSPTN